MNTRALRPVRTLFAALLVLPALALLAAPARAADPSPDVTGIWYGKIAAKDYSQDTDGTTTARKYLVEARFEQTGSDLSIETTLVDSEGGESTRMFTGKVGNRTFWAFSGDSAEPIVIVGRIAGKLPKLSIAAKGVAAYGGGFQEMKISLKRSKTAVLGTGATGAPVVGATLTLKDREGTAVQAVTGADGKYSLNVLGLTPPFLIKLDPLTGPDLYGVATAAGVANVTPFSDLILKTWYGVQNLDLATEFANLDADTPMPSAVDVALLEALVRRTVQMWLNENGLDPESFDLLRTPFDADGTGIDAVLDITTVAPDGSSLTIDDGTTSQTSTVDASEVTGTITVDTTTTSPGGTTQSTDGTVVVGESSALQTAVASALATMESFRAKINARGAALTASDLLPFTTSDLLDEGRDRTWFTGEIVTDLRGVTVAPIVLKSIRSFDEGAGILGLDLEISMSMGAESGSERLLMNFKKSGTPYLMYGNRQIASISAEVEYRTDVFPWGTDGPRKSINIDVRALKDTVSSVTVTGVGVFDNTPAPKDAHTEIETIEPTPGTEVQRELDAFFVNTNFAVDYPAPGSPITITVTPVSGTPQNYTIYSNGTTTESVSLSQPTGNSLATDAHPGTPVNVAWTLPTTFQVVDIGFGAFVQTTDFECEVEDITQVFTSETSGSLTFPTTCGGQTTNEATINLSFNGPNGERIMIIWDFQDVL